MLAGMTSFIVLLAIWSFIWKGIALWKCGRNNQLAWYIALLVVNTAGILEIIYLLAFQKNGMKVKKAVLIKKKAPVKKKVKKKKK